MNKRQRMLNRINAGRLFDLAQPRRASGDSICSKCGRDYYSHPMAGPPDRDGSLYLNRLCDGRMVKL